MKDLNVPNGTAPEKAFKVKNKHGTCKEPKRIQI